VHPSDVLRLLAKRGWIVVAAVIMTTASTAFFSLLQTPVYRSTVYLNVWPARLDLSLQQTIRGLMRNYASSITSREIALEVVGDLQLDLTPEQFQAKLTVKPVESDFVIRIDADDYDALLARDIAQHTAEVFVEDIRVYMVDQDQRDRVEVSILESALPGQLYKPKWSINLLAGAAFGLLLGTAASALAEWGELHMLRRPQDVRRDLDLRVLSIVPNVARRDQTKVATPPLETL